MPPAWLEIALNRVPKSPNKIARSQCTRILSQYWGPSLNRAINFDPPYTITIFLKLLYYTQRNFLLEIIALFDSQVLWARFLRPCNVDRLHVQTPPRSFIAIFYSYSYLYKFLQKILPKSQKSVYLLCNPKEEGRTVNYRTKHMKGRRRPTEPSDLLEFEKAIRLRQQSQLVWSFFCWPVFILLSQQLPVNLTYPAMYANNFSKITSADCCKSFHSHWGP